MPEETLRAYIFAQAGRISDDAITINAMANRCMAGIRKTFPQVNDRTDYQTIPPNMRRLDLPLIENMAPVIVLRDGWKAQFWRSIGKLLQRPKIRARGFMPLSEARVMQSYSVWVETLHIPIGDYRLIVNVGYSPFHDTVYIARFDLDRYKAWERQQ